MGDKEKILIGIIIVLLSAVLSYRIDYVDSELATLEDRINKILATNKN
jgi:hypothetical protein